MKDRDKLIEELETEAAMLKASNCSAVQQDRLLRSAQMLREDGEALDRGGEEARMWILKTLEAKARRDKYRAALEWIQKEVDEYQPTTEGAGSVLLRLGGIARQSLTPKKDPHLPSEVIEGGQDD